MQVGFYQLTLSSLEKALPRLLEKILEAGHRVVVPAGSSERVQSLSYACWTYSPLSFLPHGTQADGHRPEDQPIWLTTTEERPNGASVLVLTEGMFPSRLEGYDRYIYIYEGQNPEALERAKAFGKQFEAQGVNPIYWKQTPSGWAKE
ncbi:MAG: DNA polymerase III subunit chi [Alphaproteobacteria bacterium]